MRVKKKAAKKTAKKTAKKRQSARKRTPKAKPEKLLETRELADALGCTVRQLRALQSEGLPIAVVSPGIGHSHKYRLSDVLAWRDKGTEPPQPDSTAPGTASAPDARLVGAQELARLNRERRINLELKNAILRADLVPVSAVERHMSNLIHAARAKLLAMPSSLAPVVFDLAHQQWTRR